MVLYFTTLNQFYAFESSDSNFIQLFHSRSNFVEYLVGVRTKTKQAAFALKMLKFVIYFIKLKSNTWFIYYAAVLK